MSVINSKFISLRNLYEIFETDVPKEFVSEKSKQGTQYCREGREREKDKGKDCAKDCKDHDHSAILPIQDLSGSLYEENTYETGVDIQFREPTLKI